MNNMNSTGTIEVLAFRRGQERATVVTDGAATRSFTHAACKGHKSLTAAIAHLESHGFSIITDGSW